MVATSVLLLLAKEKLTFITTVFPAARAGPSFMACAAERQSTERHFENDDVFFMSARMSNSHATLPHAGVLMVPDLMAGFSLS